MGYHKREIKKGKYKHFSKVKEEWNELKDAREQKCKIMELVELSDLIGAIEGYIEKKFSMSLADLFQFKTLTKLAFKDGDRR